MTGSHLLVDLFDCFRLSVLLADYPLIITSSRCIPILLPTIPYLDRGTNFLPEYTASCSSTHTPTNSNEFTVPNKLRSTQKLWPIRIASTWQSLSSGFTTEPLMRFYGYFVPLFAYEAESSSYLNKNCNNKRMLAILRTREKTETTFRLLPSSPMNTSSLMWLVTVMCTLKLVTTLFSSLGNDRSSCVPKIVHLSRMVWSSIQINVQTSALAFVTRSRWNNRNCAIPRHIRAFSLINSRLLCVGILDDCIWCLWLIVFGGIIICGVEAR